MINTEMVQSNRLLKNGGSEVIHDTKWAGTDIFYDKDYMTDQIVSSAQEAAKALGMQCVGFDYVVRASDGKGFIVEMCHGFDHEAITECGGYWDEELLWHDEPLDVVNEIMKKIVK